MKKEPTRTEPSMFELRDRRRRYLDSIAARPLPPVREMDAGTREGRRAHLAMIRRELHAARAAFEVGKPELALDALTYALKVKTVYLPRYYKLRRTVMAEVSGSRGW